MTDASREPNSTKAHRYLVCRTLSESAVPVYVGDHILGFLETGEVMLKNPTKKHFSTITRQLCAWGYKTDWKQLERAYFRTCVLSPRSCDARYRRYRFGCVRPMNHNEELVEAFRRVLQSNPAYSGHGNTKINRG